MQERSEAERRAIWPCLNVATGTGRFGKKIRDVSASFFAETSAAMFLPRIRKTEDPHTQDHQRKTFSEAVGFDSTFYM